MDGPSLDVILQSQNARAAVAGCVVFHNDSRRDPDDCIRYQNIIRAEFRKAVLGNVKVAGKHQRPHPEQGSAHVALLRRLHIFRPVAGGA